MAAEYIVKEGNTQVILCERGIQTFERSTRYTLDISAIPVLKEETHLPVIVDPSHAAGKRDLVPPLARAAVAAGADGIIVEVHPRPEEALCDGPQLIPAAEFADFADEIRALASLLGKTIGWSRVRPAIVGTGLIGASVGLAASAGGRRGRGRLGSGRAHLAAAAERGAVDEAPDLGGALAGAELAVVAAPVAALPAQVRAALEASGGRLHGHRRRLDEGAVVRRGGRLGPLHRRPPDLRLRGARPRARDARSSSRARRGS